MTNEEILKKAIEAKPPEEIIAIAKDTGVDLTPEMAQTIFNGLHKNRELSDEELSETVGGFRGPKLGEVYEGAPCPFCITGTLSYGTPCTVRYTDHPEEKLNVHLYHGCNRDVAARGEDKKPIDCKFVLDFPTFYVMAGSYYD